jgi:hypothetical protein
VFLHYLDTAIGYSVLMLLLSLTITVQVQALVAVFGLRGRNLGWGIQRVLNQIDPALKAHSAEIAEKVLTHPALAHSGILGARRGAVVIRVEELFRVLGQLGEDGATLDSEDHLSSKAKTALASVMQGRNLDIAARVEQLATDVAAVVPMDAALLRNGMVRALGSTDKIVTGVHDWFETVMDRTTERFVLHTRWIAIAAAIAITLFMRLDAIQLLDRIWSDAGLRQRLVATAPGVLTIADTVLQQRAERESLATIAINRAREDLKDSPGATQLTDAPRNLATRAAGQAWLSRQLTGSPDSAMFVRAYSNRFAHASDTLVVRLGRSSDSLAAILSDSTLALFHLPLPPWGQYWGDSAHWVGGIISVMLLSLGAPFWYNALKQAANLRPVVARKVASEAETKGG